MKTVKELIANLECAPKRNGTRYVKDDDVTDAIVCLKAFEEACETLKYVANFMGLLKEQENEN